MSDRNPLEYKALVRELSEEMQGAASAGHPARSPDAAELLADLSALEREFAATAEVAQGDYYKQAHVDAEYRRDLIRRAIEQLRSREATTPKNTPSSPPSPAPEGVSDAANELAIVGERIEHIAWREDTPRPIRQELLKLISPFWREQLRGGDFERGASPVAPPAAPKEEA